LLLLFDALGKDHEKGIVDGPLLTAVTEGEDGIGTEIEWNGKIYF
jgi:hypothetical protein